MADQDQDHLDLYGPDDVNDEALYGEDEIDASLDTFPEPAAGSSRDPTSSSASPSGQPAAASLSSTMTTTTLKGHPSLPPIPRIARRPTDSASSNDEAVDPNLVGGGGGGGDTSTSAGFIAGAGLGSASAPSTTTMTTARGEGVRPSDMEGEGKMFVGGLNWETTDDKLRAYFSRFGPIDAATIMRDGTGRSRGFAFLTFVEPSSVDRVLGQLHTLDGKPIDPKRAIPHDEHRRASKVFVGGLAPSTTIETLRAFFSQFGQVLDAQVMLDRESARSKGFGFVTFGSEEACERCLALGMMEIEGKQVEVKKAQPRGGAGGSGPTGPIHDRRDGGGGGGRGGVGSQAVPPGTYVPKPYAAGGLAAVGGMNGGGGGGMAMGMGGGMGGMGAGGFPMGGGGGMMMPGMGGMPGSGVGGGSAGSGPVDPQQMAAYFRMMSAGMPGMAMGRPGQPPMMNPQFMMPNGFNPMMNGGMNGLRSPMGGMPMGMMGMGGMMRPPMGMGAGMPGMMGGMMGMGGMPFMMSNPQMAGGSGIGMMPTNANGLSSVAGGGGNNSPSTNTSISATPMRQTGSRSPNTASGGGGGAPGGGPQGPGPARSNTRGQSHFKPY